MNNPRPLPANVVIQNDIIDAHGGELFGLATATMDGKRVGKINYSLFDNRVYLGMIDVDDDQRGQSIATAMYQKVREDNPGKRVNWGYTSAAGKGLRSYLRRTGKSNPRQWYHGTLNDGIYRSGGDRFVKHFGTRQAAKARLNSLYGDPTLKTVVNSAYIRPNNPWNTPTSAISDDDLNNLLDTYDGDRLAIDKIRDQGYDAIYYINDAEDRGSISVVILDSNIIKDRGSQKHIVPQDNPRGKIQKRSKPMKSVKINSSVLIALGLATLLPVWRSGIKGNLNFWQFIHNHTVWSNVPQYIPEENFQS